MAKNLLKIGALAIGGFMILSVLSRTSSAVAGLPEDRSLGAFIFILLPVLFALVFAVAIFEYARNIELEEISGSESGFLEAGLKLLGIYLFVEGIRSLVGAASLGSLSTERFLKSTQIYYASGVAFLYLLFSFVLVKRTTWLLKWLNREN